MDYPAVTVQALRQRIRAARHIVVMTGAGMSAESGIPTFRDALTGLWAHIDPMQLASESGFRANPARVWAWYEERRHGVRAAQPNAGHLAPYDQPYELAQMLGQWLAGGLQ